METDLPVAKKLDRIFAGLEATLASLRGFQEIYDPTLAFRFNSLNFFRPGENKVSEILAYFLDPAQGHGQGRVFLDLFLERFSPGQQDFTQVEVHREYLTPPGRRIDILILFDNRKSAIAIENKIWAGDQKDQLQDYNHYLVETFGDAYTLFYLTPYKAPPSEYSISREVMAPLLNKHLFFIDYSTGMISLVKSWISNCRADRVKNFLIDFEQYLQQEINGETFMNEHDLIADYILKDKERVQMSFLIEKAAPEIRRSLLSLFVKQLNDLATELGLDPKITIPSDKPYSGFKFYSPFLNGLSMTIGFEFEEKWYRDFAFGIIKQNDAMDERLMAEIRKNLDNAFAVNSSANTHWPWFVFFREHRHWNSSTYLAIHSGELISDIRLKVTTILEVIRSCHSARITE